MERLFLRMHASLCQKMGRWTGRCSTVLALILVLAALLQCQMAPAAQGTKPAKSGQAVEKSPATTQKKKQSAAKPGGLQLETPQAPTTPPPGQKPPAGPSQKPLLQTPKPVITPVPAPKPGQPSSKAAKKEKKPERIQAIIFRGNRRITSSMLRARIFTHPGDIYNKNELERDFMALWNTGYFDDIRLEVSDGKKGKIITFFVREKKLIRSIDTKGLKTVQWSDVLEEFKRRKIPLSIESQYDPVVIKRAEVAIKEMLAAHGRQFATVRARTRNIPPNSVALTFVVVEGPKVKIGKIQFTGNTVFSSHRLVRAMKLSRPAGLPPWFYIFHKTYDHDKVLFDLEKVRELYQDHGYFYALPKEPKVKMTNTQRQWPFFFFSWGHGKRVDLTIPIEEGAQYHLGRFVIRGNKLFKTKVLKPILQMKTGDVFDRSKVTKAIDTYTKLYGEYGYINFTASPDIEPDNKKHIINLALDFQEDKQFFVHRIQFRGNVKTRDKVIRRELLIDEGSIFNTAWWKLSILRVNQLGFFSPIKKEDYDIKQNPKKGTVDITVNVKEKGKNSIGFSGGVSGLAGSFIGVNYSTNNFLGLGETLSIGLQQGTYLKNYSLGFTEPYLLDRPITTGFTVFKSDYRFDQLQQEAAYTGINPATLQQSPFGQYFYQNFSQNSTGFSAYVSYPLRRSFARVGLTYSFSNSSLQTFNAASNLYFTALNFSGIQGPSALSGIVQSQIMPTYLYNTVNNPINPTHGKYLYAALGFSGSFMGGNVNTINPIIEAKYFHPINHGRNVLAFHFLGSMVSGFGGRVPPPFSRFYIGGENDIRGFDIRSISPVVFFPTIGQVCNLDNTGRRIDALDQNGNDTGTCGSYTRFPYNTVIFPGGDTEMITSFEYRIPIAGPVTLAYFIDAGVDFVARNSQLQLQSSALSSISQEFPYFKTHPNLRPIGLTNFRPRSSTGLELQVTLPVMHLPFRVYYGYNWLRLNNRVVPPQELPPESMFPNQQTYNQVLPFFEGFPLTERRSMLGFTVARSF